MIVAHARTLYSGIAGHLRTRLTEWLMAGFLAVFGLRLLGPGETFASSGGYDHMAAIMTESQWGGSLVAVAGLRIAALTINGSYKPLAPWSPVIRSATAFTSAAAWYLIAQTLYLGNPAGTGWSTYGLCLVADIYLANVIARDAGATGRKRQHGST